MKKRTEGDLIRCEHTLVTFPNQLITKLPFEMKADALPHCLRFRFRSRTNPEIYQ